MAGSLWVLATLIAAAAQTARNTAQSGLTAKIGTLGATQVRFVFGLPFAVLFLWLATLATGEAPPTLNATSLAYTARGAVSLERLTQDVNGALVYTFTHPWSDGTTGIRLSPLELVEKLAALVPLPRRHLVRYGGCVAPHSSLRGAIIPTPRQ